MVHGLREHLHGSQVWEGFLRSGEVHPEGALRPEIEASWHRCRALGVDPLGGRAGARLAKGKLAELLARKAELIQVAKPFMQNLYGFVAGSGFVVLLFDEAGVLLEAVGDADDLRAARHLNFLPGASWSEREVGTNGVGTALALGAPVQVSGREHYCRKHHPWTCSGAPIRDEEERIIGVLDLSGPVDRTHLHTLGMVVAAVEAIRDALVLLRRNQELTLANRNLASVLNAASNGVIVLDAAGVIQQINPAAERTLSMPNRHAAGLDLFGLLKEAGPLRLLMQSGVEFQDQELELFPRNRTVPCLMSGRPIRDEEGRQQGAVLTVNPIQRLRRLLNRYSGAQAAFRFEDILGQGEALRKALERAQEAATDDSHVLLTGESGTGKEMFAQAIHNRSHRATGPFIAVNCGAIPRELLASELFGYQEGAFTGAHKGGRPGKFELAAGGTLFLDEIGEMPLDQQVALLRVLQDRTVTRLGGERPLVVDVRIICATHRDLRSETLRGTFREDLYYRLHVTPIRLPALREHREDIPVLLRAFLARHGQGSKAELDPALVQALQAYAWPGNVREFQNVVERLLQAARGGALRVAHLPEEIQLPHPAPTLAPVSQEPAPAAAEGRQALRRLLDQRAREEILRTLQATEGNVSRAAQALGLARNSLYRKMARLGID